MVSTVPIQMPLAALLVAGLQPDAGQPARAPAAPGNDASLRRGPRDWQRGTMHAPAAARGARAQKPPTIELTPRQQRQPRPPALASRGFAPFLAQQAAQAVARADDEGGDARLQRGLAAYQLAAGDEATLLGPVRPMDIRL